MKNLNLIKRLWTDSHEKQSPQRFVRYAAMLIMLLTLGVGQMWGWGWTQFESTSPATIYPGDQVTLQILLNGDGNGATYKAIGSGTTNAQANLTWNNSDTYYDYVEQTGSNHRWKFYFTPNSTGTWYWSIWLGWGSSVGDNGRYYNGSTDWNEGNGSYQSSSVTVSAVPKSGSLSAESAGTTSIALSWSKNSLNDDVIIFNGNSKTPSDGSTYSVGSNNVVYKGSGTSATITGLTANTSYTFYIYSIHQTKYYSASNNATAKTDDVATPSISLAMGDGEDELEPGDIVHLTATRNNVDGTPNITYQYSTNNGSTWTNIAAATSSTTMNCTIPENLALSKTYKFRAQMTYSATTYTSSTLSSNVSVQAYYIAGSNGSSSNTDANWLEGKHWSVNGTQLDVQESTSSPVISKTFTGCAAGYHVFKITDGTWDTTYGYSDLTSCNVRYKNGSNNNLEFYLLSAATVKVEFNISTKKIIVTVTHTGNHKTFYVRNTTDWPALYLYNWTVPTNGDWPGQTGADNGGPSHSVRSSITSSQWWAVTIYDGSTGFLLNNGVATDADGHYQSADQTYSGITDGNWYELASTNGTSMTLTSVATSANNTTIIKAPTITTDAASSITATTATLQGDFTINHDKVTDYGFYLLQSNEESRTVEQVIAGTKKQIGTSLNADATDATKAISGLTGHTKYFYVAYATNGFGTSYGTVRSFTTPYSVTFNNNGGSGSMNVQSISTTATLTANNFTRTNYYFDSWNTESNGTGTKYTNGQSVTPSGNLTLYAQWKRFNIVTGGKIYFNNSVSNFTDNIFLVVGHDVNNKGAVSKHSVVYQMTQISNTQLYYVALSGLNWQDATYYAIIGSSSNAETLNSNNAWGSADLSTKGTSGYTAAHNSPHYDINNAASTFYITTASAGNNQSMTITYIENGYSYIQQYTTTSAVRVRNTGTDAYSDADGDYPTSITIRGTYMSADGTSGRSSSTYDDSDDYNTYSSVTTGKVSMSHGDMSGEYVFDGWGTTNSSISSTSATYEFNQTAATTVYAFFTKKWVVTFNKNGHGVEDTPDTQYLTDGTKASNPGDLSETGYTFGGWYTNSACTGTAWVFGTNTITEDVDLFAKWTANQYDITLDHQDADSKGTTILSCDDGYPNKFVVTYDSKYFTCWLDAENPPTKLPYEFKGWYTEVGGAGDQIIDEYGRLVGPTDYTAADSTWTYAGGITAYTKWTMSPYVNNNTGLHGAITLTYNSAVTSGYTPSDKQGYLLQGYWTASSGGDTIIRADGSLVANISGYTDKDGKWVYEGTTPTIYARWAPITYHIAFDAGDLPSHLFPSSGSMETIDATYDEYVTLPTNTLTRANYEFAGWSKTLGGDLNYTDGADYVRNLTKVNDETVTLYALWRGKSVTVTFNAREGSPIVYCHSVSLRVGETYGSGTCTLSGLPEPTPPSGYIFSGWYTAAAGGTLVTEETIVSTTSDHTLYARYVKQERVYFLNTLGWDSVFVTFDAYWDTYHDPSWGTGNSGREYRKMIKSSGNIYYYDVPVGSLNPWDHYIAFNNKRLGTVGSSSNKDNFDSGEAVFRMDFDTLATMFVPTNNKGTTADGNYQLHDVQYRSTGYADGTSSDPQYTSGYWRVFNDVASGYVLTYEKNGTGSWCPGKSLNAAKAGDSVFVYTATLEANQQYNYNIIKTTKKNSKSDDFKIDEQINSGHCTNLKLLCKPGNGYMQTTVAGEYKFILAMKSDGHMYLTVEYPLAVDDYRVLYSYTKGSAQTFSSEYIKAKANAVDTISMFIHSADSATSRSLYIQKCTEISAAGVPTWDDDYAEITLPSETASGKPSGVFNFVITQDESKAATGVSIGKYEGDYYIRCEAADGGWDQYKYRADNLMTFSEYSLSQTLSAPFSHYFCKYVDNSSTDITYTIATDYSPMICPIQEGDATIGGVGNKTLPSGHPASIRFTWNEETNATFRSYLKSAQGDGNKRFLVLHGSDNKVLDADGDEIAAAGAGEEDMHANELLFSDTENWVYDLTFKAQPGAQVSIIARYNGSDRYLVGKADAWETIISGGADTKYDIAAVYDFKTNRLITTWVPSGTISDQIEEVDVLIERHNQDGATTITFGKAAVDKEAGSISAKRVIGALRFDYNELVGRVASWTPDTRAKMMFFISFPFDVNVSDIFGLNTNYGEAFIVQGYNGAKRAEKGFFKGDGTDTFWETLPVDTVMHAGVGYVVTLDNDYFNGDVGHIWDNKRAGDHVYMYFPSANDPDDPVIINSDDKTINVPAHLCTINRTFNSGKLNHKYTDSNWNLMGVPIFQNHTGDDGIAGTPGALFTADEEPSDTTEYADPKNPAFGYFYVWNTDKTYDIQAADGFTFKPMHSYMVQYAGDVKFTCAEPVVPSLAPRRTAMKENYNIELQVLNNSGDMLNHTYVELRENACDTFALNEDIYMMSSNKAVSVYTFAGTYDVAANVLSIGSHVVPVGVIVKQAGTYTFTMPSNFSGTVTLVDTYAQTRTNLNIEDYEVSLPKGTDEERFYLEININKVPTAIDGAKAGEGTLKDGKVHKFIMNDMMYILKDGVLYDARGNRVK